jgi:aspartyl-tRNA(Asn)/glutamyl-tRNA(Gln) amidotransferase subunit C
MEMNKSQIEKIAQLARLELSEEEKIKYQEQFKSILGFIDSLQEVDVSDLDVLGLSGDFSNQLRNDVVLDCLEDEKELAMNQAKEVENKQIKVKRVL